MNTLYVKKLCFLMLLSMVISVPSMLMATSASEKLASIFSSGDKKAYTILKQKYLSPNLAIPAGSIASQLTEYASDIAQYTRINGEKFSAEEQKNLLAIKSVLSSNFNSFLNTMKTALANAEALKTFKVEYFGKDIPGAFDASFFSPALEKVLKSSKLSHPLEVLVHLAALIIVFPAAVNLDVVKNMLKIRLFMTSNIIKHGEELVHTFFSPYTGMLIPLLIAQARTPASKKINLLEKVAAIDMGLHIAEMPLRAHHIYRFYRSIAAPWF